MTAPLPPGQRQRPDFPRFGLTPFATRFPSQTERIDLHVSFPDSGTAPASAPPANVGTDVGNPLAQLPSYFTVLSHLTIRNRSITLT